MGYDGIPYGRFMTPSLSTMIIPSKEMAAAAIEMLIKKINHTDYFDREVVFEPQLFKGASTKQ
jgi:LacI family transcriptional regulator